MAMALSVPSPERQRRLIAGGANPRKPRATLKTTSRMPDRRARRPRTGHHALPPLPMAPDPRRRDHPRAAPRLERRTRSRLLVSAKPVPPLRARRHVRRARVSTVRSHPRKRFLERQAAAVASGRPAVLHAMLYGGGQIGAAAGPDAVGCGDLGAHPILLVSGTGRVACALQRLAGRFS